jgi:hypothetical protein
LPTQQPVQLVASHVPFVWQTLPTHFAVAPHCMHARPPKPHAPSVFPVMHVLPLQQPVHVDGLQRVAVTHAPFTHDWPAPHTWQTFPAAPHAPVAVPLSQRPFASQHPLQCAGSHATVVHAPPPPRVETHCCEVGSHVTHWAPPKPHALRSVPAKHELLRQHPVQFEGPHWTEVHTPPALGEAAQVKLFDAQSVHACPNWPHDVSDVPARHAPVFESQHPLQLAGPQPVEGAHVRLP